MQKFFLFVLLLSSVWAEPLPWNDFKQNVLRIQKTVPGWCPQEQAEKLLEFVYETKPLKSVEIGAFAGSATFPIVCGLAYLEAGTVYAIDSWEDLACVEGLDPHHPFYTWWQDLKIPVSSMYEVLQQWISDLKLTPYCVPLWMRSKEASAFFADESIDFLYIDGNISPEGSLADVTNYFPKVKAGGYIWLNLAELPTKDQSVTFLMKNSSWVRDKSIGTHCLVFKKK